MMLYRLSYRGNLKALVIENKLDLMKSLFFLGQLLVPDLEQGHLVLHLLFLAPLKVGGRQVLRILKNKRKKQVIVSCVKVAEPCTEVKKVLSSNPARRRALSSSINKLNCSFEVSGRALTPISRG